MMAFLLGLTLRQQVFRRSTLLLAGLATIPVILAVVFRLSQPDVDPARWTARILYLGLVITAVLPLTALLLGTSVLGDEIEDGTVIYLLTKPLPRWQLLAPKLAAAWLVTTALVLSSTVVAGTLALEGRGDSKIVLGFGVAVVAGGLAYCTLFVLLSIVTSRALIAGLVYVFLWEGAMTAIFPGLSYLSIRHYSLGIAHWIAGTPPRIFDAYLNGEAALILIATATAGGFLLANRKLAEFEVREPS